MKLKDITPAPFPVQSGMGEHGLAYCLIKNQEARTPWGGDDDSFGVMRWRTVDHIIDLRAHGLAERSVVKNARVYVKEWFDTGRDSTPYGNLAVRVLAHIEDCYPIIGENCFRSLLCRFKTVSDGENAVNLINDAVKKRLIKKQLGRYGFEYRLAHEPRTREVCDLFERVRELKLHHPFGVSINVVIKAASELKGDVKVQGVVLTERALNAGIIFAREDHRIVIAHR